MTTRICYHVHEQEDRSTVRFDQHAEFDEYTTLADAVLAARSSARTRWELYGIPSCVIVESRDGRETNDAFFG